MGRAEAANVEADEARRGPSLKLGKYQLLAVLGRGGMAEVFLALSRGAMGFDKLAVVKRLRPGLADDDSFRTMFLDEARLAARLNHPNVVHTYEVGEHEGVYFIAMEYLEGQSLNKVIREAEKRGTPLAPAMSARIISDALLGLHHAHTLKDFDGRPLGIIHRDISPHNLFVTYEGTTKVVDFGIAKAALSSTETEVGVLKGKVAYMSPEQATGAAIDARSDIFAMGIVLWEMLTQRRLMTGDSAASTIHRLLTAPVPTASTFRHDVPSTLDAIVECALQKDPNDRFPTALAMREAIEGYLASTGRAVRTEEIGETVAAMFVDVREAIKRQIQEHVEGAGRPSADSDVRPGPARPRDGTMVSAGSGDLPLLNVGGGSGSGVVSNPRVSFASSPSGAGGAPSGNVVPSAGIVSASPASSGVSRTALVGGFAFLLVAAIAASVGTQWYMSGRSAPSAEPRTDFTTAPGQPAATAPVGSVASTVSPTLPPSAVALTTPPPTAATAGTNAASPPKGGHVVHRPAPSAAAPPPPPASDAVGFVTFDTYPWTRITEGGATIGNTPLVHASLPAGNHTFTLDNPEQGIHQTFSFTLKAGDSMTKRLGLK